jgi:hypothetical protein
MDVQRCDPVLADFGRPLDDHEVTGRSAKRTARKALHVLHPEQYGSALVERVSARKAPCQHDG